MPPKANIIGLGVFCPEGPYEVIPKGEQPYCTPSSGLKFAVTIHNVGSAGDITCEIFDDQNIQLYSSTRYVNTNTLAIFGFYTPVPMPARHYKIRVEVTGAIPYNFTIKAIGIPNGVPRLLWLLPLVCISVAIGIAYVVTRK
ncbi:unnamed protein product [marine sediment metagenome]|uniref:Uncharacterized protein n=1 Tax=marine sediment metagenome TaxID=412755 RepID=X1NRN4_9ZZZZ